MSTSWNPVSISFMASCRLLAVLTKMLRMDKVGWGSVKICLVWVKPAITSKARFVGLAASVGSVVMDLPVGQANRQNRAVKHCCMSG